MNSKGLDTLYLWLLNLTSLGWIINAVNEILPVIISSGVGLSIILLNVAKAIHWLRKKKDSNDKIP